MEETCDKQKVDGRNIMKGDTESSMKQQEMESVNEASLNIVHQKPAISTECDAAEIKKFKINSDIDSNQELLQQTLNTTKSDAGEIKQGVESVTYSRDQIHHCMICDKEFKEEQYLRRHLNTHSDKTVKPKYKCDKCPKEYNHSGSLREHIASKHSNYRPYGCKRCSKKFTEKRHLKKHMRVHSGKRAHKCGTCSRQFTQAGHLKHHIDTVHLDIRPHQCTQCAKRFATKSELTTHMRTHTGEKPYPCTLCDLKFTQKNHLNMHIQRRHTPKPPKPSINILRLGTNPNIVRLDTNALNRNNGDMSHVTTNISIDFSNMAVELPQDAADQNMSLVIDCVLPASLPTNAQKYIEPIEQIAYIKLEPK